MTTVDRYDRQVRAFGVAAQKRLRELTVAVVGVGGAGSLTVQGLAHLGVGRLILVDPDRVAATNLNRLVGATPADARDRTPKVEVAARLVRSADSTLPVHTVEASVLDTDTWRLLRCADVLLGAVDGHAPRWALNALATQYGRYYLDIGVEITRSGQPGIGTPAARTGTTAGNGTDAGPASGPRRGLGDPIGAVEVGGHVAIVRPGGPCLLCQCGYDPVLAALELDPVTRQARTAAGYLPADADEPSPSVLFLNQAVVAQALAELLNLVWPWRRPTAQILVDLARPALMEVDADRDPRCPACGVGSVRGMADGGGVPVFPARAGHVSPPRATTGGDTAVAIVDVQGCVVTLGEGRRREG
jgi:hypothetical protein